MCGSKFKKHIKSMWFFDSTPLMISSILGICAFLAVNLAIFFHNYNYWIRSYQFVMSLTFWAACILIVLYWNRKRRAEKMQTEAFKLITAPIIAMTTFMAVGSILGYLHFIYFKTVFNECDEAIEAEQQWETASDFIFFVTLMIAFVVYPVFIFRCYLNPLSYRWRWLLYLVTSTLVVLFAHIGLEEAYHTYAHLCDNQYVEKRKLCPTMIEKHHYKCEKSNFTDIQTLWLEMQEQVVGPGIFLIIAEYIPLLFVLIWMAPLRGETQKISTSIRMFKENPDDTKSTISDKEIWLEDTDGKKRVIDAKPNVPPPKPITIIVSVSCAICSIIILIRLGLLLNHVGRYPKSELLMDTIGHLASALALCAMYFCAYFLWLKKQNTKLHRPGETDEHNEHHMAHARFDAFLLKVASALITIQILVAGVVELDFAQWLTAFFLIHKIPVVASVWVQYIALKKALTLECDHWQVAGRRCAMALALAALNANFLEWVAQFVKRRFTVFILDEPTNKITPVVVAAIAISEMLYPALSFYYFHALLCWLVVFWRVLKTKGTKDEESQEDVDEIDAKEEEANVQWQRRSEIEDVVEFMDSA